jgi:bifunctional DNA-binding transcriptional regulator/antitoxin component of YhaV-PrlF toxin-antitoxin module
MEKKEEIRKLTKAGGGRSYMVILPIEWVRALGWRGKQKLIVTRYGEGILIKDWKPKKIK